MNSAERTLTSMGYTDEGGEQWKPPIGKAPDFDLLAARDARIADLEAQLSAIGAGGVEPLRRRAPQGEKVYAALPGDKPWIVRLAEDFAEDCVNARYVKTSAASHARLMEHATQLAGQGERKYISPVRTVADLATNLLLMDQSLPIYGAQYIEHQGRGRAIAVSPTVSRERIKDGRWIGEGDTLNAAVIWTRAEQPAAPIQAQEDAPQVGEHELSDCAVGLCHPAGPHEAGCHMNGKSYAPVPKEPAAKLTKPARVGGGSFGIGVPERYVIDAAQRQYEIQGEREAMTPEQFADEERKRRALWEMVHGPLAVAPQAPAAPAGKAISAWELADMAVDAGACRINGGAPVFSSWAEWVSFCKSVRAAPAAPAVDAARYRFALTDCPPWTYAVCKWDGEDWLPIKDGEGQAELDAAIDAQAKGGN